MPSFAQALKRDISRTKFLEQMAKAAPVKKPKKKERTPATDTILKTRDIKIVIGKAATLLRQVQMRYQKVTTGETKDYRIAPYSYRYRRLKTGIRKLLFAYDMDDRHIKGFVLRNIRKTDMLTRKYKPRWPVEIAVPITIFG